ncbi:Uncharacterised protein [Legionella feeleii]|uniref:Uncharacterized protein n=1 Tax=Legionella feeleii TaxID=453 RepID=A0A378ITX5_9GAMM|nr:Uncharacterised protein [Legionella feeleii]
MARLKARSRRAFSYLIDSQSARLSSLESLEFSTSPLVIVFFFEFDVR